MRNLQTPILLTLALAGCTAVSVDPLSAEHNPELICVSLNEDVIVAGFEEAITQRIESHGIQTEMFSGPVPPECEYTLQYTALKNWDMGLYLHYAELHLMHDGTEVANATYRLRNKGGFSLLKWQDVETKMDPVVVNCLARLKAGETTRFAAARSHSPH